MIKKWTLPKPLYLNVFFEEKMPPIVMIYIVRLKIGWKSKIIRTDAELGWEKNCLHRNIMGCSKTVN